MKSTSNLKGENMSSYHPSIVAFVDWCKKRDLKANDVNNILKYSALKKAGLVDENSTACNI